MNKDKHEYGLDDLENVSKELISIVLYVCEEELARHNDDVKGLPSAAMAVRESVLTFLALISHK